jgi:serine/threonine-protein phosphatase 2B catalytic subunit
MIRSRKSDIENERLPPDLYDAESEEGRAILSQPATPEASEKEAVPPNGVAAALEKIVTEPSTPVSPVGPPSPTTPNSPLAPNPSPFRRGHGRQASLGTTMTSPSTRRRSLESTMTLIKEVYDGKSATADPELDKLANQVANSSAGKNGTTDSGRSTPAATG